MANFMTYADLRKIAKAVGMTDEELEAIVPPPPKQKAKPQWRTEYSRAVPGQGYYVPPQEEKPTAEEIKAAHRDYKRKQGGAHTDEIAALNAPGCPRTKNPAAFVIGCEECTRGMAIDELFLPCWVKSFAVKTEIIPQEAYQNA